MSGSLIQCLKWVQYEPKEQFIELRAQGLSFEKIAAKLSKSKQTLIAWSRELEDEIANARSIRLDALREKLMLSKESRVKRMATTLQKMEEEVEKRDLSDIPTEKLLNLIASYSATLSAELKLSLIHRESRMARLDLTDRVECALD